MKNSVKILCMALLCMFIAAPAVAKEVKKAAPKATVVTVAQLAANKAAYVGKKITLTGYCTHLCPHGGKKMFLAPDASSKSMLRAEAGPSFGAFSKDCVKHNVELTGTWLGKRIDEAYIQKLEKNATKDDCSGCGDAEVKKEAAKYREMIAARKAKDGKAYLEMYHFAADSFKVVE